ncbi:cardiolipin synthase [Utexia brackfieldae]|uniref:cardiolipin synthase n=1 Tax=Utexia brackfieldae TaxID=3074108 RepID=UPI00370D4209
MKISLSEFYAILSTAIFFTHWLLVVVITIRIITRRRPTTYVVSWLFVIYLIPFLGIILYLLLGEVHLGKMRVTRAQKQQKQISHFIHQLKNYPTIFTSEVSPVAKPIFQLCKHHTGLNGIIGNQIELLTSANQVFDRLIQDIDSATSNIELVFYIWSKGGRANEVEAALIRAAQRGVKCRLMLDSAGSRQFLRTTDCHHMKAAGIELIEVLKVNLLRFVFRRLDLRQHRKMVIIDNHISYTGSMNIVDPRYFKQDKNVGEWVDVMLRMNGPISALMSTIYTSDWELETGAHLELPKVTHLAVSPDEQGHTLQLVASGPGYSENMIHQVLLTAIYAAQKKIILTTPYFVPSDDILNALCTVSQRGVEVIIIVPEKVDSVMVKWASRAFFTELLEANIKIFEFQHNLLHTKSVLIDEQVSFVGTVNLDMRSLWLNFEITSVIDDLTFGHDMHQLLDSYLANSIPINKQAWLKRPFWQHMVERIFYLFAPLL